MYNFSKSKKSCSKNHRDSVPPKKGLFLGTAVPTGTNYHGSITSLSRMRQIYHGLSNLCLRFNLASCTIRASVTQSERGATVGKCQHCGKPATGRRIYCSPSCRVAAWRARVKETTPGRACSICGAPIDGMRADALYCSPTCGARAARARRREWRRR